jgi:K(+)-stimulated pyrophosphate-energized sodium pump
VEPRTDNLTRNPQNYRMWLFLLAGMVAAAVLYLFYDNWPAVDAGRPRSAPPDASTHPPAALSTVSNAEDRPSAYVGITVVDLEPDTAAQLGLSCEGGVLVTAVASGSPAEAAGLERGDAIIAFGNRSVTDVHGLEAILADIEPSDAVRVVFVRRGAKKSTYVTVASAPPIALTAGFDDSAESLFWGVVVGPVTDEMRLRYDIPEEVEGVVVLSVTRGGLADSVGIRRGDVIQGLDGRPITNMASFSEAVYSDSDKVSVLDLYSDGGFRYVPIESLEGNTQCIAQPLSLEGMDSYRILFQSVPAIGVVGLVLAILGYFSLYKHSPGNAQMRAIAGQIRSGANVFLKQEYKIAALLLLTFFVVLSTVLCVSMAIAFLVGSVCSMFPGLMGMMAATTANVRTCEAAKQEGLGKALDIAFRGGSVMGISVASVGIIGLGFYCLAVLTGSGPGGLSYVVGGFCLGASFFALLGRVGGGIFTKGADVGADLTGKLEFNLSEDDPRNPAAIADNVGDNVGDVAGMGSDLFESYTSSIIASLIMALSMTEPLKYVALPLVLMALGLLSCLVTIGASRVLSRGCGPQTFLRRSIYVANGLFVVGAYVAVIAIVGESGLFLAIAAGVACGVLIGLETELFCSGRSVRHVAKMSETGAATNILAGLSVGFIGSILPIITICATILVALQVAGLYGIGLAAAAMLSTTAIIMAIDAYGPIVDNAGGIATMSRAAPEVRKITDRLDAAGNVTAAVGKGFAIGAGVITTVALFAAYIHGTRLAEAELFTPHVLVGLLIGITLPVLFAAWTIGAVTRLANRLVAEVRRQFREIKGLLAGEREPDTNRCVDMLVRDSLMATVVAGIIAIGSPFVVFFILGSEALGGFLVGAMLTGTILALSMSIGGAAWDNAKKLIEGEREIRGHTDVTYEAAVVGDTVGDPFKDVCGPSMDILIKLMVTIALVFCSLFCR